MDFDQNVKAFLKALPLRKMSGQQKFLAVAAIQSRGRTATEVTTGEVAGQWRRSVLGVRYNSSFYDRAQREGWVNPVGGGKGKFFVTEAGVEHLSALEGITPEINAGDLKRSGALIIVNKKGTHSFDKFLRQTFAEAKKQVLIADSTWMERYSTPFWMRFPKQRPSS